MTTYFTDFSEYGTGSNPSDWTGPVYGTGTFNVVDIGGGVHAMRLIPQAGVRWQPLTWNDITADADRDDIEVVAKVRFPAGTERYLYGGGVLVRAAATNPYNGYCGMIHWDAWTTNYHSIIQAGASAGSELTSGNVFSPSNNTWYWIRVRANSTSIKLWSWADGGTVKTNADTADLSVTDSAHTIGNAGIFWDANTPGTYTMEVGVFGVGTNGDAAPTTSGGAGTATQVNFTTQPSNTVISTTMSTVIVSAQDGSNVTDTSYTSNVTIALQTGTGTLSGTLTRAAVAGVATFNDLSINATGVGKVLRATSGALTLDDSSTFNIVTAPAASGGSLIGSALVF